MPVSRETASMPVIAGPMRLHFIRHVHRRAHGVLSGPGHKAECAAPREQAHAGVGWAATGREGCTTAPAAHEAVETEVSLMVYDLSKGLAKRVRCVCARVRV